MVIIVLPEKNLKHLKKKKKKHLKTRSVRERIGSRSNNCMVGGPLIVLVEQKKESRLRMCATLSTGILVTEAKMSFLCEFTGIVLIILDEIHSNKLGKPKRQRERENMRTEISFS